MGLTSGLRDFLSRSFDLAPSAFLLVDQSGTILYCNISAAAMFAYEESEIAGSKIELLVPEEIRAKHVGLRDSFLSSPKSREMGALLDLRGRKKNGDVFPVQVGLNLYPWKSNSYILVNVTDLSGIRHTEAVRDRQLNWLKLSERLVPVGYWRIDLPSGALYWSENVFKIHGMSPSDPQPTVEEAIEYYHPEDRDFVESYVQNSMVEGRPFTFLYRLRTANQSYKKVKAIGMPELDENGKVIAILGVVQDISREDALGVELRDLTQKYEIASSAVGDGLWEWDLIKDEVELSDSWFSLLGYQRDDFEDLLTETNALLHPDDQELAEKEASDYLSGVSASFGPVLLRMRKKDGDYLITEHRAYKLNNEEGKAVRLIGIMRDVSTQQNLLHNLDKAKKAAESSSKAKANFISNMSHELRTPLNSILGLSELLSECELPERESHYVDIIRSSSDTLLALINDILDFSRIEAGKLKIDTEFVSLRTLLEELVDAFSFNAYQKGITLCIDHQAGMFDYLVDPNRLRQILFNLIGNALKFTSQGGVIIRSEWVNQNLQIDVQDTGRGISREYLRKIFDRFSQQESSDSREFQGVGLGLSISKELAVLMGGNLNVQSELNQGSTFSLTIPAERRETNFSPPESSMSYALASESELCETELNSMLHSYGLRQCELSSKSADLLFIDENLLEAGIDRQMQECKEWSALPKKIFLTNRFHGFNKKVWYKKGFDAVLETPIREQEFVELLYSISTEEEQGVKQESVVTGNSNHFESKTCLVVDDHPSNLFLAQALMEKLNFTVQTAMDGKEALKILAAEPFDVVLLDVQMPGMDGLEVVRNLRSIQGPNQKCVVIALTAKALAQDREVCLDAGMSDYLSKPVRQSSLKEVLNKYLVPHAESTSPAAQSPDLQQKLVEQLNNPILNHDRISELQESLGDNFNAAFLTLLQEFETSLLSDRGLLETLIELDKFDRAARVAHRIKGSAINLGFQKLSELSHELDLLCRHPEKDPIERAFLQLDESIRDLGDFLPDLMSSLRKSG